MKRYIYESLEVFAPENKKTLILSFFFFAAGVSCGVFLELIMTPSGKADAALYLQQYLYSAEGLVFPNPFFYSCCMNLFILLFIFVSGLVSFGFPAAFAAILYKGVSVGFSAGLLIDSMMLEGIWAVFAALLPQNMLILPAFILACNISVTASLRKLSFGKRALKKSRSQTCRSYVVSFIILCGCVLAGCAIEGLLFPAVA